MKWNKKTDTFALMVGHGKQLNGVWDCGCTYGKYNEASLMLDIVKVAVKWLRKSGVKVITDADDANNRNMNASVAWANSKKATVKRYISVHCDFRGATSGLMYYYGSAAGKTMGDTIGKYCAKAMKLKFKGGVKDLKKFEINSPVMPSIILETGAIKADLSKLKANKAYGKALAKGICKYIGVSFYVSKQTKLLRKAKVIHERMKARKFKYQVSGNANSWKGALKNKTSNCATYVSYILQTLGYLKAGQIFWCNDGKVKTKGTGTASQLKKYFKITHPKKTPKGAKLKKGDICGYSNPAHTQIFAGYDKKGNALWYSFGPTDVKKNLPRKRGNYNTKKIDTVLRLK